MNPLTFTTKLIIIIRFIIPIFIFRLDWFSFLTLDECWSRVSWSVSEWKVNQFKDQLFLGIQWLLGLIKPDLQFPEWHPRFWIKTQSRCGLNHETILETILQKHCIAQTSELLRIRIVHVPILVRFKVNLSRQVVVPALCGILITSSRS